MSVLATEEMSAVETRQMSVLAIEEMSAVETRQMSSVETRQMSSVEIGLMSAVETRQMSAVEAKFRRGHRMGQCLLASRLAQRGSNVHQKSFRAEAWVGRLQMLYGLGPK